MKSIVAMRLGYFVLVISLSVLAGCGTAQNNQKTPPIQEDTNFVAEKTEVENSPLEQHRKAREDVNPHAPDKKNKFSKSVDDYEVVDKGNGRVAIAKKELSSIDQEMKPKGLKIDTDPFKKQQDAKQYVQAILAKHAAKEAGKPYGQSEQIVPVISSDQAIVEKVRIGQHPQKTRIVLDISGKTDFKAHLENNNRVLVVHLPAADWKARQKRQLAGDSLIKSYKASSSSKGSLVKFSMDQPVRLASKQAIKPADQYGHRIVLDVAAR